MAQSSSHETLVNILKNGLSENESVYKDVLQSSLIDDFFSEEIEQKRKETGEKERLAMFEIGTFKPYEIQWKIEDNQVMIRGQKKQTTQKTVVGRKFTRCITIPENILADSVTARFCARDGVIVVEGCKKKTKSRKITRNAFFSDSHFSLSIDLGDDHPLNINSDQTERTIELF